MTNHVLYRFFDEDGSLLYIGITGDVLSRFKQHGKTQPWWSLVVSATLEHYEHRLALENAEKIAIQNDRPKYNVIHNKTFRPDPINRLIDRVACLEAKLDRIADYSSASVDQLAPLPEFISKRQFLDRTGITETKFNLLRRYDMLPLGAFRGSNRSWMFERDRVIEFADSDICKTLRFNSIEDCIEILKKRQKLSEDDLRQFRNITGQTV